MPGSEPARQAASELLPCAQRDRAGWGQGNETAEPPGWSRAPITSGMSPPRAPGGLEAVPGGYRSAAERPRLVDHNPQETSAALAPVRDGSVPRARLLRATAFLLLEAIAADALSDQEAPCSPRSATSAWPNQIACCSRP